MLTITIHTVLNISQSKGNEAIKFGQLIEYNKSNSNSEDKNKSKNKNNKSFFKNYAENETED